MLNLSSPNEQCSGDLNYLIIEYLKSITFPDNNEKELLIKKVRNIFYLIY